MEALELVVSDFWSCGTVDKALDTEHTVVNTDGRRRSCASRG